MHGYFQQRGWEDVKHAKPLCIYANWAPFSNLNMNLAEMNLFTSSLLRGPKCLFCLFYAHAHKLHRCLHGTHFCGAAGWDRRYMGARRDMWKCGYPTIFFSFFFFFLLFDDVFPWHSKYCQAAKLTQASRAYNFCTDANIRFRSICQRGYPCHKS